MTYVEGFVLAVPADRKDDYLRSASAAGLSSSSTKRGSPSFSLTSV